MHRRIVCCSIALVLAWVGQPARAADSPKEIIEKAIQAHGGKDVLIKDQSGRLEIKGTVHVMGLDIPITGKVTFHLPGKSRSELAMEVMGNKINIVQIVNGAKVKMTANGEDAPIPDEVKEELRQNTLSQNIYRLTPLLDEKGYELGIIENSPKVADKETVGIEVSGNGVKQTKLFFDKKSGLLVKSEREALDQGGNKVKQETFFKDYKKMHGEETPMKWDVLHDGKPAVEIEVTGLEHPEKIDAKDFDVGE